MGCFNQTCSISGLPITAGMPIRFMLLVGNSPSKGSTAVYNTEWWSPRTFPVRAEYNDYGSVENVEEGPQPELWIKGLRGDLVEHGTGDNECHDVATYRSTIDWNSMCTAIHEGALFVEHDYERDLKMGQIEKNLAAVAQADDPSAVDPSTDPLTPLLGRAHLKSQTTPGVPTLLSVRKLLIGAGHAVVDNWDHPGYLVNELELGDVTIRWSQFGDRGEKLTILEPIFAEAGFKVITIPGHMGAPMLRLFPQVGTKDFHGLNQVVRKCWWERREGDNHSCQISQAMIREDVWQMLLKVPRKGTWHSCHNGKLSLERYRNDAQDMWDAYQSELGHRAANKVTTARRNEALKAAGLPVRLDFELFEDLIFDRFFEGSKMRENLVMGTIRKEGREGAAPGFTLQDHFKLFAAEADTHTAEEISSFLQVVAETAWVFNLMSDMCKPWIPSIYGNQDCCERDHTSYAQGVARVAREWKSAILARDRETAEEEAAWELEYAASEAAKAAAVPIAKSS